MQKTSWIGNILLCLTAVLAIFYSTLFLARQIVGSPLYRQSKLISMIVQQDSVGLEGLIGNTRNIDLVVKFSGAIASAYINFELIPLNEASTFVAIFESLPDSVSIEGFEYHRKDLTVLGYADSTEAYEEFMEELRARDYFNSVTGHCYDSTRGGVRFELNCSAKAVEAYLDFS